jgi:hypothetical protein
VFSWPGRFQSVNLNPNTTQPTKKIHEHRNPLRGGICTLKYGYHIVEGAISDAHIIAFFESKRPVHNLGLSLCKLAFNEADDFFGNCHGSLAIGHDVTNARRPTPMRRVCRTQINIHEQIAGEKRDSLRGRFARRADFATDFRDIGFYAMTVQFARSFLFSVNFGV